VTDIFNNRFEELLAQLEDLLVSKASVYNNYLEKHVANIDGNALLEWTVKASNLLGKVCGIDSEHYKKFSENDSKGGLFVTYLDKLERLKAIFLAAKEDYQGGYLRTTRSLIQAEVFDSELEQASSLLKAGYKSPAAAVVAGVVLETTLRELCDQHNLPHGKLDKMNSDLTKAGVYNKLQQKRITALADIRNSAAHGKKDDFSQEDVVDMIRDVERFVATHL
jgi:hypothetical protein